MADRSAIEWTDATWNPITGCSVVSPGCTNCYAMRPAGTRLRHDPSRAGLTRATKAGPVWTGEVRFNAQWLDQPLRWRRPRRIFVCAHGDLFHEAVPDEWIDRVFAIIALCRQHTFQVLTKRPERMREYFRERQRPSADPMYALLHGPMMARVEQTMQTAIDATFPLPNVWLGVSVEDQRRADERIPILLDTPAAVRWVSAEPLLGPIDLSDIVTGAPDEHGGEHHFSAIECDVDPEDGKWGGHLIDWVVAGGESGPGARVWPGFEAAARSLRDQCRNAGVWFYMKQMQGVRKHSMEPIPGDLMIRELPHG